MKKYARELMKDDFVKIGKIIGYVDKVVNNIFDNFCFIYLDTGEVLKVAQDKKVEVK